MEKCSIFWHRRDLRITDNAGLFRAQESGCPVQPIFIFDSDILEKLDKPKDARVLFIHQEITKLKEAYAKLGCDFKVYHGTPIEVFKLILEDMDVAEVFTNRDYEPYAQVRDRSIFELLGAQGVPFRGSKNHVIFEKDEVLKKDGTPYTVFTPYSRKWKERQNATDIKSFPNEERYDCLKKGKESPLLSLSSMGFEEWDFPHFPDRTIDEAMLIKYQEKRNFPAIKGTSKLSMHLRFGTVSIRTAVKVALNTSETWLNELIWRDFYQMILFHFPDSVNHAFKADYDHTPWINNEEQFAAWCEGRTGYPIVDAGMRELNETGFMHNRVRMIVASFLTKHLLIDWRWGERYFASKLLDFELASNVGGWQWAASSGCDAAPYFRVFNPYTQADKFDKDRIYILKWVPEIDSASYPKAIVDHKMARQRAIDSVKEALATARA